MILVENISKTFDSRLVLDSISAKFEPGKVNLVIGQSGSGKTVFLKTIVGLQKIDSGRILFNDRVFSEMGSKEQKHIRKEMGMLFQGSALFDSLTVEQNVRFPLDYFSAMSLEEKTDRVNFCLGRVNVINANNLFPSEISGGMQKRVAIARAIALNPRYLFCDEPNSGLDPLTSIVIDKLIQDITYEYNMVTMVNTHDMNSVLGIGDFIVFIHQGKKWWEGSRDEVLLANNKELQDFIFASETMKRVKNL